MKAVRSQLRHLVCSVLRKSSMPNTRSLGCEVGSASKHPACPFSSFFPLVGREHIPYNPSATLYKQNNMVSRAELRQRERLQAMAPCGGVLESQGL